MISRTLTPILSIIIAVLIFMFFVSPKYDKILTIRNDISEYTVTIQRYNDFVTKLKEKLSIKTNRSAVDNENLDRLVANDIDDTQLLVDLKALAEKHLLLFGNISVKKKGESLASSISNASSNPPASTASNGELVSADIKFSVIGSYNDLLTFISELESSLTLYEVVGLSYSVTDSPFQQFDMTVRTYALPKT